jgi:hypothetical protein
MTIIETNEEPVVFLQRSLRTKSNNKKHSVSLKDTIPGKPNKLSGDASRNEPAALREFVTAQIFSPGVFFTFSCNSTAK